MNWYIAKIVYEIICGDGDHCPQFDEQLRLVSATDLKSAYEKAYQIGQQEAVTFPNSQQQLVQWKFVEVPELLLLHQIIDGAEVYSRITEIDNPQSYRNMLHTRARNLLQNKLQCQPSPTRS